MSIPSVLPAVALLALGATARAQATARPDEEKARSMAKVLDEAPRSEEQSQAVQRGTALTVAGGVSLGAYQAGFLYYYTRFLQEYALVYDQARTKARRDPGPLAALQVVTGASAGSINALLSALTACSEPVNEPKHSPFWDVWMNVGVAELRADPRHSLPGTKPSLFSDSHRDVVAKRLRDLWTQPERWSKRPCAVQVGISATRLTARAVQIGLTSNSRLTEKFVFNVRKDGAGAPLFEYIRIPSQVDRRFYPRLGWTDRPGLEDVTDLLLASSAFPLAFPPRLVRYQLYEEKEKRALRQSGLFIDGGVLDNQPVKLARTLVKWRERPATSPTARQAQGAESADALMDIDHVYVDTSAVAYGASADEESSILDVSPVTQYGRFLRDYISAAGQSEFLDAAEDMALARRLTVPQRTLPVVGEHVLHFAAFAEKVFRENDFYVGMVDASQFLARSSPQYQMLASSMPAIPEGSNGTLEAADPVPIVSKEYACYRRWMLTGRPAECSGVAERLVTVLKACLELRTRILLGDRRADLSDVFFDDLYEKEFVYEDLVRGHPRRLRARQVRSEMRDVLEDGIIALAGSDDPLAGYVIESVGREVGNAALHHRGPDRFFALATSNRRGIDVTYSPALFADRWRPSIALQIFNVDVQGIQYAPGPQGRLLPTIPGQRSIDNTPGFGFNVGLHPRFTWSVPLNAVLQLELGVGYVAAVRLTSDWSNSFVYLRQGPAASFTVLGFERLFLDVSFVGYLKKLEVVADAYERPDILPVVGRRVFDLLFGLGWRFY
jgi:hypothetical protein